MIYLFFKLYFPLKVFNCYIPGELKCTDDHKELPCFAKPSMVDSHGRDQSFNKHAKQRGNIH